MDVNFHSTTGWNLQTYYWSPWLCFIFSVCLDEEQPRSRASTRLTWNIGMYETQVLIIFKYCCYHLFSHSRISVFSFHRFLSRCFWSSGYLVWLRIVKVCSDSQQSLSHWVTNVHSYLTPHNLISLGKSVFRKVGHLKKTYLTYFGKILITYIFLKEERQQRPVSCLIFNQAF